MKKKELPLVHEETKKIKFLGKTVVELNRVEENITLLIYMTKNEPLDMKLYNEIKDRVWKMYENRVRIVAGCW